MHVNDPYHCTVEWVHLRTFHCHNADSRSRWCYTDIQDTPQSSGTCLCCYYTDMVDMFVPRCSQDIHIRQLLHHKLRFVHYNHKLKTRKSEIINFHAKKVRISFILLRRLAPISGVSSVHRFYSFCMTFSTLFLNQNKLFYSFLWF